VAGFPGNDDNLTVAFSARWNFQDREMAIGGFRRQDL
jgi:hypothetical protein